MLLKSLLAVSVSLPLLGFLRYTIDGKKPTYLLSPETYTNNWLKDNTWASRFSVLFVLFVFLYNLFAWAVWGLSSVIEFVGFIFKQIWWLLLWIWNEVLQPTVFTFIKLIWHYTIVMIWKFFRFSISLVSDSFNLQHLLFVFIKLLLLGAVVGFLLLANLFFPNAILLAISSIIVFFFLQYTVFTTIAHLKGEYYDTYEIFQNIKIVGLWVLISVVTTLILALLKYYSNIYILNGLSVTFVQILIPATLVFSFAVVMSTLYLPAFIKEYNDDVQIQDFLKAIFNRLPKLIFGQPLQLIGIFIVSIIPILLGLMLNFGMKQVTGKDVQKWSSEIALIGEHLPMRKSNNEAIENKTKLQKLFLANKQSLTVKYDKAIEDAQKAVSNATQLKANIPADQIHTFVGDAFVGEEQSFTVPQLPGCAFYEWEIRSITDNQLINKYLIQSNEQSNNQSYGFYHQWSKAGNYKITLVPRNPCGMSETLETTVNVISAPKSLPSIQKPTGKTNVCANKEEQYTAQSGFSSYTWTLPDDAQMTSNNANNSIITVKWGNCSGPLRVKATNKEGVETNTVGIYVTVNSVPGQSVRKMNDVPDEIVRQFVPVHPPYFISREIADDSIASRNEMLEYQKSNKINALKVIDNQLNNIDASIRDLTKDSADQIKMLISELLAMIGLIILFALTLCSIWIYFVTYHYELFGFEQDGKHYYIELHDNLKSKNPNQPLLGIFVMIVFLVISFFAIKIYLLNNWQDILMSIILS
jgi:hypothetical protein